MSEEAGGRWQGAEEGKRPSSSAPRPLPPAPSTVRCPAKINLDLRVGPPRADGFHPIHSWFITVGLYDTLTFSPADDISLTCDDPTIPADARNLVWRAAEALRPAGGAGMAIHLAKTIPAGGGLGGGSSNAAATLVALNRFWRLGHGLDHLRALATTLGSDVPFFLHGPSSICTGRGDIVTPVPPPACGWALLVLPPIAMPTPAVFRRLDELRAVNDSMPADLARGTGVPPVLPTPKDKGETPVPQQIGRHGALDLLPRLVNNLEQPAFDLSPPLAALRSALEHRLGRPVRMSGSGSTLFTLYDRFNDATADLEKVSEVHAGVTRVVKICPEFDTF